MLKLVSTVLALMASACLATVARAQGFFAGKTLTILVNYDAGGPTDLEARVLARHLAAHLPGKPTIIVQNMGGAAGLVGTKWLGEIAPRDGLMMGYLTAATQRYVANPEQFKVDFRTYEFVALVPSGRIHYMRADVQPGLKTSADLLKAQNLVVGGLGPDAPKDMSMRMTLDMLGVKYKYVTGYNSSAQAFLALQRGEISYYADSPPDYNSKVAPLVQQGVLLPAFFDPGFDGKTFTVPKQMKDLPFQPFQEFYKSVKGKLPEGPLWEGYKTMLTVNGAMYRLLALPPGAPAEARDALRKAVLALNDDPDYIAEARKTMGESPEYVSSPDLNDLVQKGLSISPQMRTFMQDFGKGGR
jgi:tripartite-type tricarboxylate transporter receptor subunit TctC